MTDGSKQPDGKRPLASEQADRQLAELRELIVGDESRRLNSLKERVEDPQTRVQDLSEVLAEAFSLTSSRDRELGDAMAPTVQEAIRTSVQRNPRILADALFPVMAPAIRRAIADALRRMVQSLNSTLEHSFSAQSMKWRVEAWTSGKPFGEVVLLHTLQYRVEQVFLIHRKSGLMIQHLKANSVVAEDPDLVSGMLTAIRDFVQDSFEVGEAEGVEELQVGELSVWIEQGPQAVLAAVVRGNPPKDLHEVLQLSLEEIHRLLGPLLQEYDGDRSGLEVDSLLHSCMQERVRPRRKPLVAWIVLLLLVLVSLSVVGYQLIQSSTQQRRFEKLVDSLGNEPGIVVTSRERRNGRFHISGLHDPLASDPSAMVAQSGLGGDAVVEHWQTYFSVHPHFVLQRARTILNPPNGVQMTFVGEDLRIKGAAPTGWIVETSRLAPALLGVSRLDTQGLHSIELDVLKNKIEKVSLLFRSGRTDLRGDQPQLLSDVAQDLSLMFSNTGRLGISATVEVVGYTDTVGPESVNQPLSQRRAAGVRSRLISLGLPPAQLEARGAGSGLGVSGSAQKKVTLKVIFTEVIR